MPIPYKIIEIFTSEEARWHGKPLSDAVVQFVRDRRIAARCMVTRGTDGCYESGEIATARLEVLSFNMPIRITLVMPVAEADQLLPELTAMVEDGIVGTHELEVLRHRTRRCLIPRQFRVRDAMTAEPHTVAPTTPLDEVVRLLLSSVFTGIPVVDPQHRPVGVITQGDLIYRADLPVRLGLLALSKEETLEAVLGKLASKRAEDIMSHPVVTVGTDAGLVEAVSTMIARGLKRLPVVDATGRLIGMLSRLDVFRTIMHQTPDWQVFSAQRLEIADVRHVSDIMRRDAHSVQPETSVEEVLHIIDHNDLQRVAVVDPDHRFLGLISDQDLLTAFAEEHGGIWEYLARRLALGKRRGTPPPLSRSLSDKTAADVMTRDVITVREDTLIEDAIRLMVQKGLKRLPVLDAQGLFTGMVSRDSLLRTGFAGSA